MLKIHKKIIVFFLCLLLSTLGFNALSADVAQNNTNQVMILQIVEHPALNATRRGIEDELKVLGITPEYESAQGSPALASQIAQKFVGNHPKVLVGIGTSASQALAAENRSAGIPVVFSSVTDPLQARLVNNLKHPEGSVTGVSNYIDVALPLKFFKTLLPNLAKLGMIYNPGEVNSVHMVEETRKKAESMGMTLVTAVANNSAEVATATKRLMNSVDALFINNDNTALSAFEAISKIAQQNKTPVFVSDTVLVNQGALAAVGPDQYILGLQTGKLILKIINGEKPENISVEFPEKIETLLNMNVVKELNLTLPEGIEQQVTIVK